MFAIKMIGSAVTALTAIAGCSPTTPTPAPMKVYAFCGVNPDDSAAQRKAVAMSKDGGITATFGPCLPPPANYTTAFPGSRYATPEQYLRLTVINANAGMKTLVYDARIWSDDSTVRQAAIDYWLPHAAWLEGWDMGDEFDPSMPDWPILVQRWKIVREHIAPVTGVQPFTNHLGSAGVLSAALADLPGSEQLLSYDAYPEVNGRMEASLALAAQYQGSTSNLMCAINALRHNEFRPTAAKIRQHIADHRKAGCDSFLIFGGEKPINTPGFPSDSLVNAKGQATSLAKAVKQATR
jgi:hypothetical protein